MKIVAALGLALVAGCLHIHVAPERPRGGAGLSPGDRVVARIGAELREATVITVDGALVTVTADAAPGERVQLPRGFIVPSQPGSGRVAVGDWRICPSSDSWVPCQAERSGSGIALAYADGTTRTLPPEASLPVPSGLRTWVRAYADRHRSTETALLPDPPPAEGLQGLRPRAAGRPVAVGERVLARWSGGGWWEATVSQRSSAGVVVSWADGSAPTPVGENDVAPVTSDSLDRGDVGLCRWTDTQWWPARIVGRTAGRLHIIYSDGTPTELPIQECVAAASAAHT